jgi:NIMA (never in mitosis gene a)-related kinase 10
LFIDIGNYVKGYSKYKALAEEFNSVKEEELEKMEKNLKELEKDAEINLKTKMTSYSSTQFGSYKLIEMIGKGAFGTVYLVKKGGNKYALK